MSNRIEVRVLAVVALVGLAVLAWQGYEAYYIVCRYERTSGRVVTAAVERSEQFVGEHGPKQMVFRPVVAYEYRVGGKSYVNQRYSLDQEWAVDEEAVRRIVGRYPEGGSVEVHYDPSDPRQAVLVKRMPRNLRNNMIALGVAEALALIALVLAVRRKSAKG